MQGAQHGQEGRGNLDCCSHFHGLRRSVPPGVRSNPGCRRPGGTPCLSHGGVPCSPAYAVRPPLATSFAAAANGAIVSFGKALALDLAPLRVNIVMPGVVDTYAPPRHPAGGDQGQGGVAGASRPPLRPARGHRARDSVPHDQPLRLPLRLRDPSAVASQHARPWPVRAAARMARRPRRRRAPTTPATRRRGDAGPRTRAVMGSPGGRGSSPSTGLGSQPSRRARRPSGAGSWRSSAAPSERVLRNVAQKREGGRTGRSPIFGPKRERRLGPGDARAWRAVCATLRNRRPVSGPTRGIQPSRRRLGPQPGLTMANAARRAAGALIRTCTRSIRGRGLK